jgi:HEAT repeat protein
MTGSRLTRLLGLRPGEVGPVGLAVAMSFVVSAGLMIGQSGIEALFFARYGVEKLPVMYLVLGGTMFLTTIGFGVLLSSLGRGRACLMVPVAIAVLAAAGRVGLALDLAWITQALWLLQGAGYFLLGLSLWGLAGIVTDTRQAKRFFPLIGAGGVLGYVIGGLVTKPLASWIGTPNLLLVWIATLIATSALGAMLLSGHDGPRRERSGRDRGAHPIEELRLGLRYVRRSALLRWLALASVLFSLLFFSLYLPFSRAATLRYPQPDELAGFFGLFFGLSTGAAFLISIFLTNRLLSRFGVPTVMLVLPVLYAVAFGTLAIDASFAALAVFRFAQVAWLQGGASSSWEAVINTVPPERRDRTRAFLYGGPTQVGTVLAGVVALVGERALSPAALYGIGLVAAILAVVAMLGVRRAYPRELVRALREGRPSVFGADPETPTEPFGLIRSDASAVGIAIEALDDADPRTRRIAAVVLGDLDPSATRDPLVAALSDPDPDVRAATIGSLAAGGHVSALAEILTLSVDPDAVVRLATVAAVGELSVEAEIASHALGPLSHDRDPSVRAAAAAELVGLTGDAVAVTTLVELATDDDAEIRAVALRAMHGARDAHLAEAARTGLLDADPKVRAEATGAFASVASDEAIEILLPMLADTEPAVRAAAAVALEGVPSSGGSNDVERFAAARVAEAVDRHRLGIGIEVDDDERLGLLKDSLLDRSERDALAGLRAASLLGGGGAMTVALENLSAADPAQRANALEVIESVARRDLVRPLLSMWEDDPVHADRERTGLDSLRNDPDDWIRDCAEFASARTGGTMTETLATLSIMERVLFLRKVPLFTALPPPDLRPIASIAEEHVYVDGDTIARQGDVGEEMHIIVSGAVSVAVRDGSDAQRVVAVRSEGDVVGEMAIVTNEPRMADLVARGSVRLLSIDRRRFESIIRERPETALGVIRVLSRRLAESPQSGDAGAGTTTASTS